MRVLPRLGVGQREQAVAFDNLELIPVNFSFAVWHIWGGLTNEIADTHV